MDTDKANEQRNLVDNPAADRLTDEEALRSLLAELGRNGTAEVYETEREMVEAFDQVLATARQQGREEADNLLELAWGVIANAGWDDLSKSPGWQEAAERWRDRYHAYLDAIARGGDRP